MRHNRFRYAFWEEARAAGLDVEKEKANLLPERPDQDGIPTVSGRRPADVFWKDGEPVGGGSRCRGIAWDFAVTSGMRADRLRGQGEDVGRVFREYEDFKRQHLDTATQCSKEGFFFEPLVVEAHGGGWSGTLRKVIDDIAARQTTLHEGPEPASLRIAQRLTICLQAENARAILKRLTGPEPAEGKEEEVMWETGQFQ